MNAPTNASADNAEFLLLFRNTQLENRLSTDEMREAMQRLNDWLEHWSKLGHLKSGQPLGDESRVISGTKQRSVADGPFAEAKEAVGGYVLMHAADFDEATKIAGQWPLLDYGGVVEVRPVRKQCATTERVGLRLTPLGA